VNSQIYKSKNVPIKYSTPFAHKISIFIYKMMKKIIIHYGMHKTGTTAIQDSLYKSLKDPKYFLISLRQNGNSSRALIDMFSNSPLSYYQNKKDRVTLAEIHKKREGDFLFFQDIIIKEGEKTALISGEDISTLKLSELYSFKKYIKTFFNEIKLVGYIRHPLIYNEVSISEKLKWGITANLFNIDIHRELLQPIRNLDKVFGKKNVDVILYDESNLKNNCSVSDFCSRLKIDLDYIKTERSNISLSCDAIRFYYTYRLFQNRVFFRSENIECNWHLFLKMKELPGKKLMLGKGIADVRKFKSIAEKLEIRSGQKFEKSIITDQDILNNKYEMINNTNELFNYSEKSLRWLSEETGMIPNKKLFPCDIALMMSVLSLKAKKQRWGKYLILFYKVIFECRKLFLK